MSRRWTAGRLRRHAAFCLIAGLLLAPVGAASAATPGATVSVSGGAREAAVQLVLDRVLGPGNGVVAVSQTIRSSTSTTTSVRWGPAVASSSVVTPGAVGQQDLVSGTSTMTVTPPGALVRQSVSVAVDRAHLGGVRIGALRQLIAAAAGVVPSRGDTLSVVVARFAGPSAVKPPTTSIATVLMPYVVPAVWAIGGLVALLVVARSFRRRPRGQAVLRRL